MTHIPAALFTSLVSGYFFLKVIVFAVHGHYIYQTKTNIGHPIDIALNQMPVTFLGLCFIQLAFATWFGGLALEGTYHTVRILKPSLNLSLRPQFKFTKLPLTLLVIGAILLLFGVLNISVIMLLEK